MENAERDRVIETLAQELDIRTPTASMTPAVNRILVAEFIEENEETVTEVVKEARDGEGGLHPFFLTEKLLDKLETFVRTRLRPEF